MDPTENILSDGGPPVYPAPWPCFCDLCWRVIWSADDATFWHGYGNCMDITEAMWWARWEAEAKC